MLSRENDTSTHQSNYPDFPSNLDAFSEIKSLGGGTNSTYQITNPNTKQSFVLKYGAHLDAIKVEIVCNAIYQILGVPIPKSQVYQEIPKELAEKLNLSSYLGIFQVSEFLINDSTENDKQIIIETVRQYFMIHALLGNIDVAKEENFIVNNNQAFLIDAGANFIYRSLGERRHEGPFSAGELFSLRDEKHNQRAQQWFSSLSESDLISQLKKIIANNEAIEKIAWKMVANLAISPEIGELFLQSLSDRLDNLITRFCPDHHFAKIDKKAYSENTAAGILTYTKKEGEIHILLAERIAKHEKRSWWDNFGGKSDIADTYLWETAIREVQEESSQNLRYTRHEIVSSPSHDLITVKENTDFFLYRMYIAEHHYVDVDQFKDKEHTTYRWIPLQLIKQALDQENILFSSEQPTIAITLPKTGESIVLYPPLYAMLISKAVADNLNHLLLGKPLLNRHTQSRRDNVTQSSIKETRWLRALISPEMMRNQISSTLLNHSFLLQSLRKNKQSKVVTHKTINFLSQSELHLKAVLGEEYTEDVFKNVRLFLTKYTQLESVKQLNDGEREKLINHCLQFIELEKQGGNDYCYFYHACDNNVAYAYTVYTLLYSALQASSYWTVFRASQQFFIKFPTLQHFIAHYSNNSNHEINNNKEDFNHCALSTNIFLFGNHDRSTSSSIDYLLANRNRRDIDLLALFEDILQPFNVSANEIYLLLKYFRDYKQNEGGSLYQIKILKHQINDLAYPAITGGKVTSYRDSENLLDILNQLQADIFNPTIFSQATETIKSLQARLFLPPNIQITAEKLTWGSPENKGSIFSRFTKNH